MPTMHDVARRANVSLGTVSRVINGAATVHPTLRGAVEQAVRELGYRPNAAARSLRVARTDTVGVVVSEVTNPAFMAIVHGIERVLTDRGVALFLCDSVGSVAQQRAHLDRLCRQRVDGVIFQPISEYHDQIEPLRRAGVPIVVTGRRRPGGDLPEIVVEEREASRDAFALLLRLGHRRIAFLVRGASLGDGYSGSTRVDRLAAYREAHAAAAVPIDPALLVAVPHTDEAGPAVARLLRLPAPPTALVCGLHADAPAMLGAVRAAGLRVPDDLSFITYGDTPWTTVVEPALTVVRRDYAEYGRRTASLLLALAAGEPVERSSSQQAELVVRGSCAVPRPLSGRNAG